MSRFRIIPALLAISAAPVILNGQTNSGQGEAALSRYVQPNANLLIGVNWSLIRQSQSGEALQKKWLDTNASLRGIPGLEFLQDIDRILVSGRSPGKEVADPELLIALGGHFDLPKLRKALLSYGLKPQLFNSIQVYRPQGTNGQSMAVVLLNAQTVLLGDPHSVFATLERSASPQATPDSNAVLARSHEMDANYDIWVIGNGLNALTGDRMPDFFGVKDLAAEERGFEAGVAVRNGLTADFNMRFETEQAAKSAVLKVEELIKTSAKDKGVEAVLAGLEKNLRITSEGPTAKINLRLTQQELEATATTVVRSRMQAATASLTRPQTAIRVAPAPPKPEKQVIRIEGLDDGPRVIPYQQP